MTERARTVTWEDPCAAAQAGLQMAGVDYLRAMAGGPVPAPPALLLIGAGLGTIEPGRIMTTLVPGEHHDNSLGTVHGGMIATLLDSVMGCAVHSMLPAGRGYMTLELKMNFLRPVGDRTGVVTAEGVTVHVGRQSAEAEGKLRDAAGKIYAVASTTCLVLDVPK